MNAKSNIKLALPLLSALSLVGCYDQSGGESDDLASSLASPGSSDLEITPYIKTFHVNSTSDSPDAFVGDGLCETDGGECTLRAAVQEATALDILKQALPNRTAVIILPEGVYKFTNVPSSRSGQSPGNSTSGVLSLAGTINILGAGARKTIIDGNDLDRVFYVGRDSNVTIADVTITGGNPGGIWSNGEIEVLRSTITENYASYGAGIFITPFGFLKLDSSTVSNNVAVNEGGGIRIDADGLIVNSTITGNRLLDDCCTSYSYDGGASGEGGGIDIRGVGRVSVINSTIVNNHAILGGGGVNIAFTYTGDQGGILDTAGLALGGPLEVSNSIIAHNTSVSGGDNCKNTISPVKSLGGNVTSDGSCEFYSTKDIVDVHLALNELADNGGPTDTHSVPEGSSTFSNAITELCPFADQRGVERDSARCDSGALQSKLVEEL